MSRRKTSARTLHPKRALLFLAAAAAAGGLLYGANRLQVRRNADKMLGLARVAASEGDTPLAARLFTDYLNFQPKDASAIAEYVGVLEKTSKNRPRGVRDLVDGYERLLQVDPTRADDRKKLVTLYIEYQYFGGATDHLDALLDPARGGTPDDPVLLSQYATCELRTGRPAEAAERLRAAVATRKAAGEDYIRLAEVLRALIKTPEALEESAAVLKQLGDDRPADAVARVARARYALARNEPAQAERELAAAKAAVPEAETTTDFALLAAELRMAANDYPAARAVLTAAADANPAEPRLRFLLAEVLVRLDAFPLAKAELQKAAALLPADGGAVLEAADRKIDFGMLAEAKADAARFEPKPEYKPMTDYLIGRVLAAEGNWPAALLRLTAALPAFEKLPRFLAKAYATIGACHKLANNPDKMLAAYAAAVKADPDLPAAAVGAAEANALLGRPAAALPVFKKYAGRMPEARVAAARLALAEQFARPAARRNWAEFDAALGHPPYPTELVILRANSLIARDAADAAETLLRDAVKSNPADPATATVLAAVAGRTDPAAGIAVLDAADKPAGDRAALRVSRARLLARGTPPNAAAIAALGENAAGFVPAERFGLYAGLADVFAGLNKPAEAEALLRKAAAESPFNVAVRVSLFEFALRETPPARAEEALAEIRKLEGPDGPTVLFGEALRRMPGLKPTDTDAVAALRAQVGRAVAARESWGRAYVLLGDLDALAGETETALDRYRKAFELGERGDVVVRRLVRMLFDRTLYDEARQVLESQNQSGTMAADLQQQLALVDVALTRDAGKAAAAAKAAENSKDPQDHFFRGQALLLAGDKTAPAAFEKAVTMNPLLADGWIQLARSHAAFGSPDLARAAADRGAKVLLPAADKFANKSAAAAAVGLMYDLAGDPKTAEGYFTAALKADPRDALSAKQLVSIYRNSNRPADAVAVLDGVISGPIPEAEKHWARRVLAVLKVARPGGFKDLSAALALVETNLKSGNRVEDERAKAILVATDPFRRAEAKRLFQDSARRGPFTADESAAQARIALEEGNLDAAETLLKSAARGALATTEHLVMLHRVQIARNRPAQAAETLTRLKASAPGSWQVVVEEARAAAKAGDKTAAAKLLLGTKLAADPAARAAVVAPTLAELGCTDDAERLYRAAAEGTRDAAAWFNLAVFYVATGRAETAVEIARGFEAGGIPAAAAARVFAAAAAVRARDAAPPAGWTKTRDELAVWVQGKLAAAPGDRDLRSADAALADAAGRYEDAAKAYETILAADPGGVAALNNLAFWLAVSGGDADRAVQLAARAVEIAGPRPPLLDTRGTAYLAANKPEEAVKDLTAAVAQEQKPVYYFHLALAHDKLGAVGRRIEAVDLARAKGLKKANLHPKEWPEYDRLFSPGG